MHLLLLCLFCDILHTKKSRHQKSCINGVVSVVASEPSAVVVATKGRKKKKKNIGLEDLLCTIATKYQGSSSLLSTARTGIFSARMRIEETGKSSR